MNKKINLITLSINGGVSVTVGKTNMMLELKDVYPSEQEEIDDTSEKLMEKVTSEENDTDAFLTLGEAQCLHYALGNIIRDVLENCTGPNEDEDRGIDPEEADLTYEAPERCECGGTEFTEHVPGHFICMECNALQ